MDDSRRKHLNFFIYMRFGFGFFEFISFLSSCSILFFKDSLLNSFKSDDNGSGFGSSEDPGQLVEIYAHCPYIQSICIIQIIASALAMIHTVLLLFLVFDQTGRDSDYNLEKAVDVWNSRLKMVFCCVDYSDIDVMLIEEAHLEAQYNNTMNDLIIGSDVESDSSEVFMNNHGSVVGSIENRNSIDQLSADTVAGTTPRSRSNTRNFPSSSAEERMAQCGNWCFFILSFFYLIFTLLDFFTHY